ncbi:MAG: ABC transporter ATP-binding protein [Planctomycetaceae bacterium]|nr:ABC transporter ATP-binding protein [Planctomycetaceae bacterium]
MTLLEVNNLKKSFGELVAVDDLSFHVDAGEVLGLLGPNGAGKSTTMMMLAGLLPPDSGTIRLNGQVLDIDNRESRRVLGVVPQDLAIYPELTGRENLEFFGRLYGIRGQELADRVDDALERVGLKGRQADISGDYSGGMKRRLNFAVALLHRPQLLILDEPTVGVDPQSRSHLMDCIRDVNRSGVAVIYASHYMEEVQAICDRVAIVDRGKMLVCDRLQTLLDRMESDLCLQVAHLPVGLTERLKGVAEIRPASGAGSIIVVSHDQHADEVTLARSLSSILNLLDEFDVDMHSVETHPPNLERLFLELTGNSLRD